MEKTAIIVPGEKQEIPGPYNIRFENIVNVNLESVRENAGVFSKLQGGFFLYLMGLSSGLLIFGTETLRGCFSRLKNRFNKKEEIVTKIAFA